MRQIFSWTVGSFFRTIGRTVALLGMGALLYYIATRLGFGLSDLFFDKVKASSYQNQYVSSMQYSTDWGTTWTSATLSNNYYVKSDTNNGGNQQFWFKFDSQKDLTNVKQIKQNMIFRIRSNDLIYASYDNYVDCTIGGTVRQFNNPVNNPQGSGGNYYEMEYEYTDITCKYYKNDEIIEKSYILNVSYYYNDNLGLQSSCYIDSANSDTLTISCPVTTNNISGYVVNVQGKTSFNYDFGFYFTYTKEFDNTQSIIDNQNQNTQSIIQQEQNSTNQMLDTNSTATDTKADSFFGSFDSNETYGGLSSIVTAPLVVVNEMLSNTCVAPSATWKGATISLPCGDMFWNRPGADDLKNLLNVFYGGFICYYAIRKLFLMIENFKDPTHDKIEVTDL